MDRGLKTFGEGERKFNNNEQLYLILFLKLNLRVRLFERKLFSQICFPIFHCLNREKLIDLWKMFNNNFSFWQ